MDKEDDDMKRMFRQGRSFFGTLLFAHVAIMILSLAVIAAGFLWLPVPTRMDSNGRFSGTRRAAIKQIWDWMRKISA